MLKKVSIIIPTVEGRDLKPTLESANAQTYQNTEIIIQTDLGWKNANVTRNHGFERSTGDLLFFCDDDIVLEPRCIEKLVWAFNTHEDDPIVYCNYRQEGAIEGVHQARSWDYQQLRKVNYISTMSLIERRLFEKIGKFDEKLERYQDWDLWLRAGKVTNGVHINESLFTAYYQSGGISLQGPISRRIHTEKIKQKHGITERTFSIIMSVKDELGYTKNCINSILKNTGDDYEIIVIDDHSGPETRDFLRTIKPFIKLFRNKETKHHTYCMNKGAEYANGEYLILLNNDTLVTQDWNVRLLDTFKHLDRASCVGPLTSHAASIQQLTVFHKYRNNFNAGTANMVNEMLYRGSQSGATRAKITGFCLLTSRELYWNIGGFDPAIPAGGNEASWIIGHKLANNLDPYLYTGVYVHHFGSRSYIKANKTDLWEQGKQTLIMKHGEKMLNWLEQEMYLDLLGEVCF